MEKTAKKYGIEVKVYDNAKREYSWERLQPTNGTPYQFASEYEAQKTMNMCYPDHPEYVRIVEINA